MNNILTYIILGIIQGLTEPLPISSSGHIFLFKNLFNTTMFNSLNFEIISNFGSFIAIFIIFWKDIVSLVESFFKYIFKKDRSKKVSNDFSYCLKIIIATIPAGVMGLVVTKLGLLAKLEENVKFIGLMLLLTALFLFLIRNFKGKKDRDKITFIDSVVVGLCQMISIIPGISRSGATIVGGMFRNIKRESAFNFSFILYIPISIATSILGVKDLFDMTISTGDMILYIIAALMALIFTYIFTKWFSKIVKEGKLIYFSIYCVILGFIVILFL